MKKYAIIDIETTGGRYNRDKIIEIGIVVTDGINILNQYQSLVHPERTIPLTITRITGINDEMVVGAPKFYEIAKDIVNLTKDTIFVAHNVRFDYSFIKEEFRVLGYAYNKKTLCTVKLTRNSFPGLKSYSLGNLIKHFHVEVKDRHRAFADAYATYEIFKYIFENSVDDFHFESIINNGIDASVLPKGVSIEDIHEAPETPGVYYLSNSLDQVIYVGKAKNIKKRLFQHFRRLSKKSLHIHERVHKLSYEQTGNELNALLLELYEIKRLRPELNRSLKRNHYPFALYYDENHKQDGPSILVLRHNKKNDARYDKVKLFSSKNIGDSYIQNVILEKEICQKYVASRGREFACHCGHNCTHFFKNPHDLVRSVIDEARNEFSKDFIAILPGKKLDEKAFILILNRRFYGMGYLSIEDTLENVQDWVDRVQLQFYYPEAHGIIKNYFNKNTVDTIAL